MARFSELDAFAKRLQRAMQIDLKRYLGTLRQRSSVGKRTLLQHDTLYRFPLARRQIRDRTGDDAARVGISEPTRRIGSLIGMAFEGERRVHLA